MIGFQTDVGAVEFQQSLTVVGSGDGRVRVFDTITNAQQGDFRPYGGFMGEIRVVVGDVSGDGVPNIITAPGQEFGPIVKVFDGASADLNNPTLIRYIDAYNTAFQNGVFVAAANLNPQVDNFVDIITGSGPGFGGHIRAFTGEFQGTSPTLLQDFFAFPAAFAWRRVTLPAMEFLISSPEPSREKPRPFACSTARSSNFSGLPTKAFRSPVFSAPFTPSMRISRAACLWPPE